MSRSHFSAQPMGILDRKVLTSSVYRGEPYIHNPYWYEGFDPQALSGYTQPTYGQVYVQEQPWQWPERRIRVPVRPLRTSNLKFHLAEMESQRLPMKKSPSHQSSDNSSDHTLGYSDSEPSDRDTEERDAALEAQLVQCIIDYFGDCQGSLPSERVQNVIKKDYADLYEQVVVARYRKKWHKFLQHCSDTFHLFTRPAQPAPNQDYCWRIRLVNNNDWEEADQVDEEFRAKRDRELLDKVQAILNSCPEKQCLMIDVINDLNKDAKDDGDDSEGYNRKARKIRAGDLKRLMRKCNSNFTIVEYQDGENQKRATYMKLLDCGLAMHH